MTEEDKFSGALDVYVDGDWWFYGVGGEFCLYNKSRDTVVRMDEFDAFSLLSVMCKAHHMLVFGFNQNEGE